MGPIWMTLLLAAGWGVFAYSAQSRFRLLKCGSAEDRCDRPGDRLRATWRYAIQQVRMRRYPLAGFAHMLVFLGFLVLLLRSLMLWARGYSAGFSFWFLGSDQPLGKVYGLLKDLFAVLVIVGAVIFVYNRVVKRLSRLTLNTEGLIILAIIIVMMLADIFYDGASMVLGARASQASLSFHLWEPAGSIAQYLVSILPTGAVNFVAHLGFWTHSALVLIFLNLLPYSKHFHIITGIPNVYLQNLAPPGRLPPTQDIEGKLERSETLGVRRITDYSWKALLDLYTCTECGRCSDQCPATRTGKKLSPKHFTVDLRDFLYKNSDGLLSRTNGKPATPADAASAGEGSESGAAAHEADLVGGVIDPEVLWACTSCRACETECPVFITYVDKFVDLRRHLVMERGEFPTQLQSAFRGLETNANPWSFPAEDRAKWSDGLGVKTIAENPDAPVLFWVGCAPSFDERAKKVTVATVKLLQKAGVDFAILGQEERCTGDPARRAGNEYLFQMFAQQNVETLNGVGADKKKILTTCPHCFNTLLNEYADFGGKYDVIHHTTFLAELVSQGKLKPTKRIEQKVAFHDSCYLGRYNEVYDAPRETLRRIPGLTILEPAQTRDRGMCCGAGGAQFFKEEEHGEKRVNTLRTEQLLDTNPDAVSSACPFCMRMLTDGLADKGKETMPQLDVAELLLQSVGEST